VSRAEPVGVSAREPLWSGAVVRLRLLDAGHELLRYDDVGIRLQRGASSRSLAHRRHVVRTVDFLVITWILTAN